MAHPGRLSRGQETVPEGYPETRKTTTQKQSRGEMRHQVMLGLGNGKFSISLHPLHQKGSVSWGTFGYGETIHKRSPSLE